MKTFKIKVGIQEFPVDEKDVPRIVQAMQSNDIVQLSCGLFRGNVINALVTEEVYIETPRQPTQEEIKENLLKKALMECTFCNGTGWVQGEIEGRTVARECKCQDPYNIKI